MRLSDVRPSGEVTRVSYGHRSDGLRGLI
ncbi:MULTISPECIES: hypothetical protein [unclassified Mesorhizobium]